jgi:hypothetical protein
MGGYKVDGRIVKHSALDSLFYKIVPQDHELFLREVKLATTERQKKLLSPQTVHGHAVNGDKAFAIHDNGLAVHHQYVNATISDICDAIIRNDNTFAADVDEIKNERYDLVRELKGWITEVMNHIKNKQPFKSYNPRKLQDKRGNPLMGIELFNHTTINNPANILRGIYLGSRIDSDYWRAQTECYFDKMHGISMRMHRGICTAGNIEKIIGAGLSIADISRIANFNERQECDDNEGILKLLMDKGLIVDFSRRGSKEQKYGVKNQKPYVPVFAEISRGFGVSDDAAFNYLSLRDGIECGLGFILIDAVDTIDKCLPNIKERGEDESLGDYIESNLRGSAGIKKYLDLREQDIINLIYAAAIDPENHSKWPSCSQRRFLEYQHGNYALLNHIDYIKYIKEGTICPDDIRLSIKLVTSNKFYGEFLKRILNMESLRLLEREEFHYAKNLDSLLKAYESR